MFSTAMVLACVLPGELLELLVVEQLELLWFFSGG